jgi:N-glycosylase/DNA lyase
MRNIANLMEPMREVHRLHSVPAPDFDLEKTLNSGQVFHWMRSGKGFLGAIDQTPIYVEQQGSSILVTEEHAPLVARYFALDHSLPEILKTFPADPVMNVAVEYSRGLRVIRQPQWECLATFLTSALKQVQHISAISLSIRKNFGGRLKGGDPEIFGFPTPEQVARIPLTNLLECKLGFRAANLSATAQRVAAGAVGLERLNDLSIDAARTLLCSLPGVGEKIANCVLLFGYGRLDAVPIDVWISRIINQVYFADRTKVSLREMKSFAADYFGPYAGYAQQYLFHHWRLTYRKRQ